MALIIASEIWWGGIYENPLSNSLTGCESFFTKEVLFGSIKCLIDEFSPL